MMGGLSASNSALLALALSLEPERANRLLADLDPGPEQPVAVLIGTAFPWMTPRQDWQMESLRALAHEGWRTPRRRADALAGLAARVSNSSDGSEFLRSLRRGVWAEKVRIALRELLPPSLGGAPVSTTARELSGLAEASLSIAVDEARRKIAQNYGEPTSASGNAGRFFVLAMGKLAGEELNAGSDIDVCFYYDTDEGTGQLTLHEHWSRVARRVVRSLEHPTADGLVWRVDLRLRPEGSRGALANSIVAAERYYETWGRLWERSALLRSRAVAGDLVLGAEFEREIAAPFVFRRDVEPRLAESLAELLHRSRMELSAAPERDLKLGPGGIREVEFFVQSLQLIWGGRHPQLRVKGTWQALERLRAAGFVSDVEARSMADAYTLLRTLEHRVQWMSGIQTHLIPEDSYHLELLSRSLGLASVDQLVDLVTRTRSFVERTFAGLLPGGAPKTSRHWALYSLLDGFVENPATAADAHEPGGAFFAQRSALSPELRGTLNEELSALGDDESAAEFVDHLVALSHRPNGLLGALTREKNPGFADRLLEALLQCADPIQAALTLRSFFGRVSQVGPYIAALTEDERALRRLVVALGASVFVGEAILSRPDMFDVLVAGGGRIETPRRALRVELDGMNMARFDDEYERQDAFVGALRRAKSRVVIEVAAADLAGTIEMRDARRVLADLADESLERAAEFAFDGDVRGLSIIALGKLGGRDIGYGSDLDVIFIYDRNRAPIVDEAQSYFIRRAQQIVRLISNAHPAGRGYELDTRLRPSGSQGMLVTSLEAFAVYHGVRTAGSGSIHPAVVSSGATWERQVLLRARCCAGDREIGRAAIEVAERAAYERGVPDIEGLIRVRARMEHELAKETKYRHDLKHGRGGLVDIEFVTQWLQMQYGKDTRVRTTDTAEALERLGDAGYLDRPDYLVLQDGYTFLRRLEQRIHVLHGSSSSVFDERSPGLARLARRMAIQNSPRAPASEVLVERYRGVTNSVRAAYCRILALRAD